MSKTTKNIASAIKDASKAKTKGYDTSATVKRVEGSTIWVHIPGGVDETPVRRTIDAKPGDAVQVRVAGGKAWLTGNESRPPTDDAYAQMVGSDLIQTNTLIANTIEANEARFGYVEADTAKIHHLEADEIEAGIIYTNDLIAENVTTEKLTAASGYIEDLTSKNITAEDITADHAAIDNLDANYAHITNGIIDNATINHANVNDLNTNYAQIGLANVDQAIINTEWVDALMVQSGLISHAGSIFELDAIQVNASKIKTGTLDVERLIVSVPDSQDPTKIHKYMVHVDPSTGQPSYEKVDADVLEDLTITADKIVAEAITADKITTQNILGPGGWINLRNGTFAYADAGENNYLKWDGSKLQIKADEFVLSTGQNIIDAIESIGTYFLAGVPTLTNEPAVNWNTDNLKRQHLRDVYYDTDSGKSYRWSLSTEEALQDENGVNLQDEEGYDLIGGFTEARYAWIQISDGDLDNISDRVSVCETKISQNQEEIQLKASKTDLDLATSRLTQAETTIAQNAQAISLKAEASSVYSKLEVDGKFHEGLNVRTSFADTSITLTATVILAGTDVTNNYMPGDFEWFYRMPDGDVFVKGDRTSSYGKSITIQKSGMKYGNSITCVFTKRAEEPLLDGDGNPLTDENDEALTGYVEVA